MAADDVGDALRRAEAAASAGEALSIGLLGNAADILPALLAQGAPINVVTDQTSAHDPLTYLPRGVAFEDMPALRAEDPAGFTTRARESMAAHVEAMVGFLDAGAEVFDYGNSIRGEAELAGYTRAFAFPGFVPAYIRPLFCQGKGPFRWAALSGDPADIAVTDRTILDLFPGNEPLARWIRMAQEKVHFQGLPARICWLGYGERHLAGLAFNDLVARGEVRAPIVIGRDHLDCGSVASPYRETEAMADGSDAIADWPILNALVNTASGASWVSVHHGGGVGIGRSIHAGQVCVADGTPLAAGQAGTRPHQRPGHGRDPPRGRRVRRGRRGGPRPGRARPDVPRARARRHDRGGRELRRPLGVAAAARPRRAVRRVPAVLLDAGGRRMPPLVPPGGGRTRPQGAHRPQRQSVGVVGPARVARARRAGRHRRS